MKVSAGRSKDNTLIFLVLEDVETTVVEMSVDCTKSVISLLCEILEESRKTAELAAMIVEGEKPS
jgi:hypothetical protein